ncbi:MAG: membrane protein insertion efficiency factor YidD [Mariprofundus sp.]|nr:membrane protein insertion efficiency factor YidD [Mariprofundus sp.]
MRHWLKAYLCLAVASLLFTGLWQTLELPRTTSQTFPSTFYQHIIGSNDGRSCPSYPVCSQYAAQAIDRYGLLLGSWLTLDRLIHEADDLQLGPWLIFGTETRLHDPLERNAFWLQLR